MAKTQATPLWFTVVLCCLVSFTVARGLQTSDPDRSKRAGGELAFDELDESLSVPHSRALQRIKSPVRHKDPYHSGWECREVPRREACRVMYNRVTKSGSQTLIYIINALRKVNGFKFEESSLVYQRVLSGNTQRIFAHHFNSDHDCNTLYTRPIRYFDFIEAGESTAPTWINMIRNPIRKAVSGFYRNREHWDETVPRLFDKCVRAALRDGPASPSAKACLRPFIQIPYFCGHDPACKVGAEQLVGMDNTTRREHMQRAREAAEKHVVEKYLVVGFVENIHKFVEVLEILLPMYFSGARRLYKERVVPELDKVMTQTKEFPQPTPATVSLLEDYYAEEMAFYEFVKTNFYQMAKQCGVYTPKKAKKPKTQHPPPPAAAPTMPRTAFEAAVEEAIARNLTVSRTRGVTNFKPPPPPPGKPGAPILRPI